VEPLQRGTWSARSAALPRLSQLCGREEPRPCLGFQTRGLGCWQGHKGGGGVDTVSKTLTCTSLHAAGVSSQENRSLSEESSIRWDVA